MLFNSAATLLKRCSSHWLSRERDMIMRDRRRLPQPILETALVRVCRLRERRHRVFLNGGVA